MTIQRTSMRHRRIYNEARGVVKRYFGSARGSCGHPALALRPRVCRWSIVFMKKALTSVSSSSSMPPSQESGSRALLTEVKHEGTADLARCTADRCGLLVPQSGVDEAHSRVCV